MTLNYESPESLGMNPQTLWQMIEELNTKAEIHSIVVMKEGKIVLEKSWAPYTLEGPQMMHSLSKLGVAICTGFAIEEGKLHLEDSFLDYVREDLPEQYPSCLEEITIYDLLTMQAGSKQCFNNLYFRSLPSDWERTWLREERVAEDIGKVFRYDSGCSYTLSVIASRVMGKACIELLQERIFSKMDLGHVDWLFSPEGYNVGGWGMYLNARQIAMLGQLMIQKGSWNGAQLIPQTWVEELSKARVSKPEMKNRTLSHYGYHMHMGKNIFAAEGSFQQLMVNTSYREEYMLRINGEELICGWKPNVTYLNENDASQRVFKGKIK